MGPSGPTGATGATGVQGPQGVPGSSSALAGKNFGVLGASISALFGNAWQNVVIARTGMKLAFQDARPGRGFATAFECYGTTTPGTALKVNQGTVQTGQGPYANTGTPGNTLAAGHRERGYHAHPARHQRSVRHARPDWRLHQRGHVLRQHALGC